MGDDDFGGVVRGWDVGNTVCKGYTGWFRVKELFTRGLEKVKTV